MEQVALAALDDCLMRVEDDEVTSLSRRGGDATPKLLRRLASDAVPDGRSSPSALPASASVSRYPRARRRALDARGPRPRATVVGQDAYPDLFTKAAALVLAGAQPLLSWTTLAWLATYVLCAKNSIKLDTDDDAGLQPGDCRGVRVARRNGGDRDDRSVRVSGGVSAPHAARLPPPRHVPAAEDPPGAAAPADREVQPHQHETAGGAAVLECSPVGVGDGTRMDVLVSVEHGPVVKKFLLKCIRMNVCASRWPTTAAAAPRVGGSVLGDAARAGRNIDPLHADSVHADRLNETRRKCNESTMLRTTLPTAAGAARTPARPAAPPRRGSPPRCRRGSAARARG